MSKTIESTVEKLPHDLAKAGVMGSQHVFVTVLDESDVAQCEALRADIQVGIDQLDHGEGLDSETVFAELDAKFARNAG